MNIMIMIVITDSTIIAIITMSYISYLSNF